ncbi:MAG: hypothetical protein ACOY42_04690 [Pseudomonadota bacterium]
MEQLAVARVDAGAVDAIAALDGEPGQVAAPQGIGGWAGSAPAP